MLNARPWQVKEISKEEFDATTKNHRMAGQGEDLRYLHHTVREMWPENFATCESHGTAIYAGPADLI